MTKRLRAESMERWYKARDEREKEDPLEFN